MSKNAASNSGAALRFTILRFVLGLFPKPAKRLIIRLPGASGLSRLQREILAWLWLWEASGELGIGALLEWQPRKSQGFALCFEMPGLSAATSRALARLEQRGLVIREAPNGRTTGVWLTHAGRDAGKLLLPQFRDPFTARDVQRKHWQGLSAIGDVDAAIARLVDRGWLLSETEQTGGAPKETFWKHPAKAGEK